MPKRRTVILILIPLVIWSGTILAETTDVEAPALSPPPEPEVCRALNEEEARAGVVVMEAVQEYQGDVDHIMKSRGSVTRRFRYRFLVLDETGVERIAKHAFFGRADPDLLKVRGRTLAPDGSEYRLDPEKDIRDLDIKDAKGKVTSTIKACYFPHVEPGAVLDLAWVSRTEDLPDFEYVTLQSEFPIRTQTLAVQGHLYSRSLGKAMWKGGIPGSFYWVPFFLGPVPPRAHARLNEDFDLELTVEQVAPFEDELLSPPAIRTTYALGLIPRYFSTNESDAAKKRRQDLILFGSAVLGRTDEQRKVIDEELDPDQAIVRLDEMGLQIPPQWSKDPDLMDWWWEALKGMNETFDVFFRRESRTVKDLVEKAATSAPETMDWRERAEILFRLVRETVPPSPEAENVKKLSRLSDRKGGSERDVDLLYVHLCRRLGIPARMVVTLSRNKLPFIPILESWGSFGAAYMVEVGDRAGECLYLMPGDIFATFHTMPAQCVGALAFRQPDGVRDPWPMFRIHAGTARTDLTVIHASADLDPSKEETDLRFHCRVEDTASWALRWRLGWAESRRSKKITENRIKREIGEFVDNWTDTDWEGEIPEVNHLQNLSSPYEFELVVPYRPDIQRLGDRFLVPSMMEAYLFNRFLLEEGRKQSLWLPGGDTELRMLWVVPPTLELETLPPDAKGEGPGGLRFERHAAMEESAEEGFTVSVTLKIHLPDMLLPTEYFEIKAFFDDLQEAAQAPLLFRQVEESSSGNGTP